MKETLIAEIIFFPNSLRSEAQLTSSTLRLSTLLVKVVAGRGMKLLLKKETSAISEWGATPVRAGLKVLNFEPYSNQKQFHNSAYMLAAFIYGISRPCLHSWAVSSK